MYQMIKFWIMLKKYTSKCFETYYWLAVYVNSLHALQLLPAGILKLPSVREMQGKLNQMDRMQKKQHILTLACFKCVNTNKELNAMYFNRK